METREVFDHQLAVRAFVDLEVFKGSSGLLFVERGVHLVFGQVLEAGEQVADVFFVDFHHADEDLVLFVVLEVHGAVDESVVDFDDQSDVFVALGVVRGEGAHAEARVVAEERVGLARAGLPDAHHAAVRVVEDAADRRRLHEGEDVRVVLPHVEDPVVLELLRDARLLVCQADPVAVQDLYHLLFALERLQPQRDLHARLVLHFLLLHYCRWLAWAQFKSRSVV